MQKIMPHLWYDKEAKEATEFYVKTFGGDSHISKVTQLNDTPSGSVDVVTFTLLGHSFQAISAGPYFQFNPSISLIVSCETPDEVDRLWNQLSEGGNVLMPLDAYPFSERYGWCADRYGLSWQLIYREPEGEEMPRIVPSMLFTGKNHAKAEQAMQFYLSVFKDSKEGALVRYTEEFSSQEGILPDMEGKIMFADFNLLGTWIAIMDSGIEHDFTFNEAFSFIVHCETQEEIDEYWEILSADPEAEQCGWLKDQFGISWQIVPSVMNEMLQCGDQAKVDRLTQAFLQMKKFDIAELERVFQEG